MNSAIAQIRSFNWIYAMHGNSELKRVSSSITVFVEISHRFVLNHKHWFFHHSANGITSRCKCLIICCIHGKSRDHIFDSIEMNAKSLCWFNSVLLHIWPSTIFRSGKKRLFKKKVYHELTITSVCDWVRQSWSLCALKRLQI